jgi:hypothetical protein
MRPLLLLQIGDVRRDPRFTDGYGARTICLHPDGKPASVSRKRLLSVSRPRFREGN